VVLVKQRMLPWLAATLVRKVILTAVMMTITTTIITTVMATTTIAMIMKFRGQGQCLHKIPQHPVSSYALSSFITNVIIMQYLPDSVNRLSLS